MSGLFGFSASEEIDPEIDFALLKPRGQDVHGYLDGWGVAVFDGKAARIFKETRPFAQTALHSPFRGNAFHTRVAISHLNRAEGVRRSVTVADIQPFERELGGRSWVLAHDGALLEHTDLELGFFRPIGESPSERAFCSLLEGVRPGLPKGDAPIDIDRLVACLVRQISVVNNLGLFNFIMSDGEHVFVHAHTVLHTLERTEWAGEAPFAATLIASYPLTDQKGWQRLPSNSLTVFRQGRRITQMPTEGEAPGTAWGEQRAEAQTVQRLRGEAEECWRQHCAQIGDAMNYESG
ncbi:class II glutamine amidotransferase [Phyllobacterium myrsinacearum]|uniref:Glutamine amidotransferase n=1 Tax=Phyllobacterium myrsinacearum TaxID=28101 RepID=A0A839ELX8_9HYPH|nr:class II glutamine amidotransferase [Phyllobacterium myrsinacearum]MBA8879288.1 glutamine amidotransferase [Phyllobacterium myrsinacearum]